MLSPHVGYHAQMRLVQVWFAVLLANRGKNATHAGVSTRGIKSYEAAVIQVNRFNGFSSGRTVISPGVTRPQYQFTSATSGKPNYVHLVRCLTEEGALVVGGSARLSCDALCR